VVEEQDCRSDVDCPSLEICYQSAGRNRCVDPCTTISPCVTNAACRVHSTTPTRTMSCICFEGYTGNGIVSCDKIIAPIEVGCSSDDECASNQACRNRACVNPCGFDNPCASTAQCTVDNHRPNCKCPPGMTGDPYSRCIPIQRGECQHDVDCPDNRACIENQCLDPCIVHSPCGKSAVCETTSHRPVCRCPSGWAGDPHTECYTCRLNSSYKIVGRI
jgi:hypothetical protein